MKSADIIKTLLKDLGLNQTQLAALVGMKNQTNVSEALKRDMKISVFNRFINALGYEVVIRKKTSGSKGKGVFIVEDGVDE